MLRARCWCRAVRAPVLAVLTLAVNSCTATVGIAARDLYRELRPMTPGYTTMPYNVTCASAVRHAMLHPHVLQYPSCPFWRCVAHHDAPVTGVCGTLVV